MRKLSLLFLLVASVFLCQCVGSDEVEIPTIPEVITISSEITSLKVGETQQVTSQYFDEFGDEMQKNLEWSSSNAAVATVDGGLVTAVSKGQANITASILGVNDTVVVSNGILFTVIEEESELASVNISASTTSLSIGDSIAVGFTALDGSGNAYEYSEKSWSVSNENIISIDTAGLVKAKAEGTASVTLTIDGVNSQPLAFTVSDTTDAVTTKTGAFQALDYEAKGTATLFVNESDDLILEFGADFETVKLLGTVIYLANSLQGSVVKASGLEVLDISDRVSGAYEFNITALDASATIDSYQYVVIMCKPAGISMGYAELK